jgi:2-polyprenyl-3-methyl-5-hydroxy-6-metoxy-1,4-benzoquinol methylase
VSYASIEDLRSQLGAPPSRTPEYIAKMLHPMPTADVVDRAAFILERVKGKRVLEFGASGPMQEAIVRVADQYLGVDRESRGINVVAFDLDNTENRYVPQPRDAFKLNHWLVEIIVCGEVIEHLCNPGWFLARIKQQYPDVPMILSTPNAFSKVARQHAEQGTENVNIDHVAWYSPRTLLTLLTRAGFTVAEWHWYNGQPGTAEGLIVVTE